MSTTGPPPLRVAIFGGGIGAIALTVGLLSYPHIDVHVYEAKASFSETSAAVGLGTNALKALELIDKEGHARAAVDKAGMTRYSPTARMIMGKGPHAGEHVLDVDPTGASQASVSRARLLSSLISLIPPHRLHTHKRLRRLERADGYSIPATNMYSADYGPLTVYFADGTTLIADAVVGADRIYGVTRLQMFGVGHPATPPKYTGQVAWRCVVPLQDVRAILPRELSEIDTDLCMVGEEGFLLWDRLDGGEMVSLVAVEFRDHWENEIPVEKGNHKVLSNIYEDWGPAARSLIDLMKKKDLQAYSIWQHPHAFTFTKGRICLMGDAAHASTPWLAIGAGQALEDALLLATLLGETYTSRQVSTAFRAFDLVRRPRTRQLVDLSRETGEIFRRADKEGLEVLQNKLRNRWEKVWAYNVEGDQTRGLEMMRNMRGGEMGRRTAVLPAHGQGNY